LALATPASRKSGDGLAQEINLSIVRQGDACPRGDCDSLVATNQVLLEQRLNADILTRLAVCFISSIICLGLRFAGLGMRMKTVVMGKPSGASMEEIMKIYPRHKVVVEKFIALGVVVGIGPFDDLGNMAIFKTRAAAEQYIKEDPFIQEGVVKSIEIREWKDSLLQD
jgi:uncharacterized protein YciI